MDSRTGLANSGSSTKGKGASGVSGDDSTPRKGDANPSSAATSGASFKGKGTDQLSDGVSNMNLNPSQDDGWREYGKNSKNKNKGNASMQRGSSQYSAPKAWGNPDTLQKLGMHNHAVSGRQMRPTPTPDTRRQVGRDFTNPNLAHAPRHVVPAAVVPPPLKNGWGWASRTASTNTSEDVINAKAVQHVSSQASVLDEIDGEGDESDGVDDSDDELMSDGFDSDESQKSHETRKKNRWLSDIFQCLDDLTVEQINETERQWHCPACKGGPGAIDWYRGLIPLISHAKTIRSKRVKLHRELAELLEEELKRKGTSAIPAGEAFGKWKGLKEVADKEIIWPPMVVIMNTQLERDESEKWIGMGNQELLEYFSAYSPSKARHSYGPQGHRGMSVLIFEASAVGYAEAERLSKHFEDNCRDRNAWERNRALFYSGGKRQLYGYMAMEQDMLSFNQHSQGKSRLKYDKRSYQEMVVNQMKQMSEENHELLWYKNKIANEQKSKKALQESFGVMSEKFRRTADENHAMKVKTQKHHEQNKNEMDDQEQFFHSQFQKMYDERNEKEELFEKLQQIEREKVAQLGASRRAEEFNKLQDKEMEEFEIKRDRLMNAHKEKVLELRLRLLNEEMELEKEFDLEFSKLMDEYIPKQQSSSS